MVAGCLLSRVLRVKTFEEAISDRHVFSPNAAKEKAAEITGRYSALIQEIASSRSTHELISDLLVSPSMGENIQRAIFNLMLSAFVNGVMVGIEMEKSE